MNWELLIDRMGYLCLGVLIGLTLGYGARLVHEVHDIHERMLAGPQPQVPTQRAPKKKKKRSEKHVDEGT